MSTQAAAQALPGRERPPEPQDDHEAYLTLVDLAHRKTGHLPPEILARHVLAVTAGADWPVRRAALEALLRRISSAQKEKLRISTPPPRGQVLGVYATRRGTRRDGERPYTTLLLSVAPPAGRCDCPDFARSSLGLCKHLFAVLDGLVQRPRKLAAAQAQQADLLPGAGPPRLSFAPVRPLLGPGDPLAQVRWLPGAARELSLLARRARRWFAPPGPGPGPGEGRPGPDGVKTWSLRDAHPEDPRRRLGLVRDLLALLDEARAPYHDPSLLGLLREEEARLAHRDRDAALGGQAHKLLAGLLRPLYPYQVEGLQRFLQAGRLLLADDMGLGKTVQAIAACHVLWHAGRVRRGLLCVPASLKPQWLREWQDTSEVPAQVVDGNREERQALYQRTRAGFLIVNYEQVLRDLPDLQAFAPDMVVLDEAQRIKNWATKTAAYVKTLEPAYRLVLTGTPMENRLEELASIMEWVDPMAVEPKWRLGPWHTMPPVPGGPAGAGSAGGARHLDTLRERLAPSMLRRVRREVLAQLPARTDTRVPVEMTPQQREEHDALYQPIARLIRILQRRPLTLEEHQRLMILLNTQRIICNGLGQLHFGEVWPALRTAAPEPSLREGLFMPKVEALRDLVKNLCVAQGRKLVVFSQWRRMLALSHWAVRDILGQAGLRAVTFTGADPAARRTQNIVEFHDDPAVRVMLLTDAGGVGLNLQRAASCCVNLELPWNPAVLEQRISRIYRLGQKLPIDVYNLVTEGGIEARVAELLGSKKALFAGLFDSTSNEVRYDQASSFLSRLGQLVPASVLQEEAGGDAGPEDGDALAEREIAGVIEGADEALDQGSILAPAGEAVHVSVPGAPVAPEAPAAAPAEAAPIGEEAQAAAPAEQAGEAHPAEAVADTGQAPVGPVADASQAPPGTGPSATAVPATTLPAEAVRRFFAEVRVERTPEGGMNLSASPAAAETLAALFAGMAQILGQAGPAAR